MITITILDQLLAQAGTIVLTLGSTMEFVFCRFRLPRQIVLALVLAAMAARDSPADEFFVAPGGRPNANGAQDSPWDLSSALSGARQIPAGSTIWLQPGVYRHADRSPSSAFVVGSLEGTADAPIQIRGVPGGRATIDGGLAVGRGIVNQSPPRHIWFRDFEIAVTEKERSSQQAGSGPTDIPAPFGGLNVYVSDDCKFINLIIHNNVGNGVGLWASSRNTDLYGCVVYANGWSAPDRGHGHGFYAQNREGWQVVSNCIFSVPEDRGELLGQFYGSDRNALDNFRLEQNIAFAQPPRSSAVLLGGGAVSHNNHAINNYFYNSSLQLGYSAAGCTGGKAMGNVVFRGSLNLRFYDECRVSDNLVVRGVVSVAACGNLDVQNNKQYYPDGAPDETKVILLPNKYDGDRAHLAVFNWSGVNNVTVSTAPFLKSGDSFRLVSPTDYYGKPVLEGRCEGDAISLPIKDEFAAFVLFKTQ